jgi:hypothetical protein
MRYMLLIYTKEGASQSPEQAQIMEAHSRIMEEATRKGIFRGAEPLAPTSTATTLRRENGKTVITDGPFAETKEQLAGYYILDCNNLDEVLEIAARIPTACGGGHGCIEIRPLRAITYPQVDEAATAGASHG